jgi:SAM-dependent methyltransferase
MSNRQHDQPGFSVSQPEYWEELYRLGKTGWDLGASTPVFSTVKPFLPPTGKVLVLGSGTGHDAIFFAEQGYQTIGVDFAASAVARARQNAERRGVKVEFLQADLFTLPERFRGEFDIVLEYVTFCAIDPARRTEYRDVVAAVLNDGGFFVALFFPIDGRTGGPPFSVDPDEVRTIFGKRFHLLHESRPLVSVQPRRGNEILMIWKKLHSPSHHNQAGVSL